MCVDKLYRTKENEETTVLQLIEPETVTEFPPIDEDIFTQTVQLDKSKCRERKIEIFQSQLSYL